jgi:uncharacterized membrane protein
VYLVLKSVHVLAVVLFLGNIITGVFWKAHADRTGDPRIIAHTLDGIIRSDRWFTIPGVLLIIASGVWAAILGGLPILGTPWIWQSLVLFGISGLAFGFGVAPLQLRLRYLAFLATTSGAWDEPAYRRLSARWAIWGLVATLAPVGALALMVLKPTR